MFKNKLNLIFAVLVVGFAIYNIVVFQISARRNRTLLEFKKLLLVNELYYFPLTVTSTETGAWGIYCQKNREEPQLLYSFRFDRPGRRLVGVIGLDRPELVFSAVGAGRNERSYPVPNPLAGDPAPRRSLGQSFVSPEFLTIETGEPSGSANRYVFSYRKLPNQP